MIGIAAAAVGCVGAAVCAEKAAPPQYDAIIAKHARANGVPERLIRRVIMRESRYNPAARNGRYYGMMQILPATAKSMGFSGAPTSLHDADVNLTYGVRYLAGAYKVAGGDEGRAMSLYASGYYYHAKRKGMLDEIGLGRDGRFAPPVPTPVSATQIASLQPDQGKVQIETAAAAPRTVAAIPLPPRRDIAVVAEQRAEPKGFLFARRASEPAAPAAAQQQPAVLAAAAPLPPRRDLEPATTAAIPQRAVAPVAQQTVLAAASPVAPLPPQRDPSPVAKPSLAPKAATSARPAPVVAVASARPAAAPRVAEADRAPKPAAKPRTISPAVEPALASAGPALPVPARRAEPATRPEPTMAYSGPTADGDDGASPAARAWADFDDKGLRR